MPVKHISNYAQFVDGIFNDYKTRSLLDKEFKTIAAVEIEIKKLQKMVSENLALSSMRGSIVSRSSRLIFFLFFFQHFNWTEWRKKNVEIFQLCFFIVYCSKIWYHHIFRWDLYRFHEMPYHDSWNGSCLCANQTEHGKISIFYWIYWFKQFFKFQFEF